MKKFFAREWVDNINHLLFHTTMAPKKRTAKKVAKKAVRKTTKKVARKAVKKTTKKVARKTAKKATRRTAKRA